MYAPSALVVRRAVQHTIRRLCATAAFVLLSAFIRRSGGRGRHLSHALLPFPSAGAPFPHYFGALGGTTSRPLLVVYTHFSDVADPPGQGLAWASDRYFDDEFPSAVHYYTENSSGALTLSKASESQGTPNDGVDVNAGASGPFLNPPGIPLDPDGLRRRNKASLQLADPYVDFSSVPSAMAASRLRRRARDREPVRRSDGRRR